MLGVWTMDISTVVFSRIVNDFSPTIKTKYKMQEVTVGGVKTWRNFSTSQTSMLNPIFPYIAIIEIVQDERHKDLEGRAKNLAFFAFQVDIIDNVSENRAKECMQEIMRIMDEMRFTSKKLPAPSSNPQEYRESYRFERLIGSGDVL